MGGTDIGTVWQTLSWNVHGILVECAMAHRLVFEAILGVAITRIPNMCRFQPLDPVRATTFAELPALQQRKARPTDYLGGGDPTLFVQML